MKEHLGDSDDSDYACNPWGFDEDDMFELACQGIKPWDPEAGMALAVLNGYIDIWEQDGCFEHRVHALILKQFLQVTVQDL